MKAGNSRVLRTILLILITIILCPFAYGKIIYVDDDAVGANDGTSWENAYVYLQEALADAGAAEKPVEIRVAQGIYKPNGGLVAIPEFNWRTMTFQLINDVALKGGYAGINLDPNERDVEVFETILSGDLNGDDVDVTNPWNLEYEPTRAENSYHVINGSGTDETALLDGFTIIGGKADTWSIYCGGGMIIESGSPTIINCKFLDCSALDGGALCCSGSRATVINCIFRNNLGFLGAGICSRGSDLTLKSCVFIGNIQASDAFGWFDIYWAAGGGGIRNESGHPTLTDCMFINNSAEQGGGLSNYRGNSVLINCTFTDNIASFHRFNSMSFMSLGGGIRNTDGNLILTNCTFSENSSAWYGGGIHTEGDSDPILTNCIFSGNSSVRYGGGISEYGGGGPTLINCTFVQNLAPSGSALACDSRDQKYPGNVELKNCIFWERANTVWNNDGTIINTTYSNIQGGQAGMYDPYEAVIWGEGNIDVDPLFVEPGYWVHIEDVNVVVEPNDPNAVWVDGDYHLKSQAGRWDANSERWVVDDVASPCIDAGDPNSPVGDEPEPNGGRVNMGAYGGTAEASKSGSAWWFETTQGPVVAEGLGVILPHEHIFTDLRGPGTRGYGQADAADVVRVMAPFLEEAKQKGVGLLFECSSIGVGRNVSILSEVSKASGLPVVVPTGVYGRANFAPVEHRNMSEDELKELFISEIREGIEETGIKAGFIKIATGGGNMTALEEKFLRAAGRAARETGAAVASHTNTSNNVTREADILESIGPDIRFVWVHAQSVNDRSLYRQLAERGVFIEFDSLGWNPGQDSTFIAAIKDLLAAGLGEQILLSHDAGWYQPGEQNGGTQMPYTYLIETFIPKLRDSGVDDEAIRMITEINPIRAFGFNQDVKP